MNNNRINGRFAPGNPGGPGRPRRQVEREYLDALTAAVPMDRWRLVVDRAVEDAIAGDPRARDWLGRYLIGNPTPTPMEVEVVEEAVIVEGDPRYLPAEERAAMLRRILEIHAPRENFAECSSETFHDMPSADADELRRMVEAYKKTPEPKRLS